jgi:outer membrane protein assembly factor BamB
VDVYEAASGALRYSLKAGGKHWVRALFIEDGGALLTLGDVKLHRWDMATGEARWEVKADKSYVGAAALSRDGRYLTRASGWLPALKVYDAETGVEVGEVSLNTPAITAMASGPDGRLYLACVDTQLYEVEWARLVPASI